jgi:hypothetical protein
MVRNRFIQPGAATSTGGAVPPVQRDARQSAPRRNAGKSSQGQVANTAPRSDGFSRASGRRRLTGVFPTYRWQCLFLMVRSSALFHAFTTAALYPARPDNCSQPGPCPGNIPQSAVVFLTLFTLRKLSLPNADDTTNYRSEGTMKPLLASLALTVVLTPALAFPIERDGLTLFFSFEDVREIIQDPTPQRLLPPLALDFQSEELTMSRIEREAQWGGGLGFDGCAPPSMGQRSLWGY